MKTRPQATQDATAPPDLFDDQVPGGNLTIFHAGLVSVAQTDWPRLFSGFDRLKAITFSSSLGFLIRLAEGFADAEIVLGSERILTRQHALLAQAS